MSFVYYHNLTPAAKKAFDKGNGKHGKFVVDSGHIAELDKNGRAKDFIKVIKTKGKDIEAQ